MIQPTHHPAGGGGLLSPRQTSQTRSALLWLLALSCCLQTGCMSLFSPVSGVPAHRLPPQFHAKPKNDLIPIDVSRLRQAPPRDYLVAGDDILAIYIQGVLGKDDEPPPINLPQPGSDLPPAIGYPVAVRRDGKLPLPLISPIKVDGLTLEQIEVVIRRAYTVDNKILQPGKDRITVTLMKKRTYTVTVMREDGGFVPQRAGDGTFLTSNQVTRGYTLELPAYKNDVLTALADSGGLPGLNAQNEVKILRSNAMDRAKRDAFVKEWFAAEVGDPCLCRPPLPDDPAILRIPLRLPPGQTPTFSEQDIILEDGDIVVIEGREREVFYTGGLLGGGEFPLPRDYDLDVIGAMSIVGQGVGNPNNNNSNNNNAGGRFGGIGVSSVGGIPPGQLYILRKTPCNGQITIAVDLNRAINSPAARPLIESGDILVLMYKPEEELLNFGLGTFFTFGIAELLRSN